MMSNDGLIIENMDRSHIYLAAVKTALNVIIVKRDLLSIENVYSKKDFSVVGIRGVGYGEFKRNKG